MKSTITLSDIKNSPNYLDLFTDELMMFDEFSYTISERLQTDFHIKLNRKELRNLWNHFQGKNITLELMEKGHAI